MPLNIRSSVHANRATPLVGREVCRLEAIFFLVFMVFGFVVRARAVDPDRKLYQYAHTAWRTQDDNFDGTPTTILQDSDGYIWVGTSGGLSRLSGTAFVPVNQFPNNDLRYVKALLQTRDGRIWIGSSTGLQVLEKGQLINVSLNKAETRSMLEGRDGVVWVTRVRIRDGGGPLCKVVGHALQCYGSKDGVPDGYANALAEDSSGNLWFGTSAIYRWHQGQSAAIMGKQLRTVSDGGGVRDLLAGPNNTILAAWNNRGPHMGLEQFSGGTWTSYDALGFQGQSTSANVLYHDRQGALWVGTADHGLYRIFQGVADHFDMTNGLSGDTVNDIREDAEGTIWVATVSGVDNFRDVAIANFSHRQGLRGSLGGPLLARTDGSVWIAEKGLIDVWRHGNITPLTKGIGQNIRAFFEDHTHKVWIAVDDKLVVYEHGQFRRVPIMSRGYRLEPETSISSIGEDSQNNLLALIVRTGARKLAHIEQGAVVSEEVLPAADRANRLVADTNGGFWIGSNSGELSHLQGVLRSVVPLPTTNNRLGISDLLVTSDNVLLVSTGVGLFMKKADAWRILDANHGLPCSSFNSAVVDDQGGMWLIASCGLLNVSKSELDHLWLDSNAHVRFRKFDLRDGDFFGNSSVQPRVVKSRDGRLWFTNGLVLQMIDPARVYTNTQPPPVHVDRIVADRKVIDDLHQLRLLSRTRDIEIDYSGQSYVEPHKILFRYRLENHDKEWHDAGTRRQAFYSDLPPGKYRFRVIACNNDNLWNQQGASTDFTVLPAFYQTLWFQILMGIAVVAIIWTLYSIRLERLSNQVKMEILVKMGERERIARDLHDTFFQSVQGLLLHFQTATSQIQKNEPARSRLEDALRQSDTVMLEGRKLLLDLRNDSIENVDIVKSFMIAGDNLKGDQSVSYKVAVSGECAMLHPIVSEELYRIGCEALTNSFRHAKANAVEVEIQYGRQELTARFRDDGVGIAFPTLQRGSSPGHWGLPGMRERALKIGAQLSVWSRENSGTEIEVRIPRSVAYLQTDRPSMLDRVSRCFKRQC
jgi:signal transduction histidine kinase/ligand-binding sensor domain-containing protein